MQPESIQIQTIDYCNRKCKWCPNSKMQKDINNVMPDTIFDKILNDLKSVDYKGAIHLYLMGEPLFDKNIVEKIGKTRLTFPGNTIFISTNGDCLSENLIKAMFDAGITWIGVSHYDDKNKYLLKLTDKYLNVVHTTLGDLRMTFYNRAGHSPGIACIDAKPMCNWVFNKAYINYKGDVILCCSDYDYEIVFGNIIDTAFGDIYNNDHYNDYRKAHETGNGKKSLYANNATEYIKT